MGTNMGKWSDVEKNLLLAGASNAIVMNRTGRTMFSVSTARSKLSRALGKKIIVISDTRFLAEERRKIREMRRSIAEQRSAATITPPKKVINIDELRKLREKDWVPTASGAGVMCVPKKKIMLRDNIVKYKTNPQEPTPVDPKSIHEVETEQPTITIIEPAPSKDELFFEVNGTRVTVSAGTKKVDIMPYGLIIEF